MVVVAVVSLPWDGMCPASGEYQYEFLPSTTGFPNGSMSETPNAKALLEASSSIASSNATNLVRVVFAIDDLLNL